MANNDHGLTLMCVTEESRSAGGDGGTQGHVERGRGEGEGAWASDTRKDVTSAHERRKRFVTGCAESSAMAPRALEQLPCQA